MLFRSERLGGEVMRNGEVEQAYQELRVVLFEMLRQSIRPEFLNRIDEIILFKLLNGDDLKKIVELQLKHVETMIERKNMTLEVHDEAKEWLIKLGYDPTMGARPLKRVIQKYVVNKLSEELLASHFNEGDTIVVELDRRGLVHFTKKMQPVTV